MKWRHVVLIVVGVATSTALYILIHFPDSSAVPVLVLMEAYAPFLLLLMHGWYFAMPGVMLAICGMLVLGVWRVWFEAAHENKSINGALPPWPTSPSDEKLSLVVGEVHPPFEAREVFRPKWLVIPERGLFTGMAIVGAVGSGKTSACMRPFAEQLFRWNATDPELRAAGLVLEVKGDFCHDIRQLLTDAKRGGDYMELTLGGYWQWNPLASHWLDSYSLAYTISSLLNQLFGKGKDPFWQMAYTNLLKWLIELHRIRPGYCVTLQDLYRCTINPKLFKKTIEDVEAALVNESGKTIILSEAEIRTQAHVLGPEIEQWTDLENGTWSAPYHDAVFEITKKYGATILDGRKTPELDHRNKRLEAVKRWYEQDWMKLDEKLRTSCVEGISSFLSLFDMPDVAETFCPKVAQDSSGVPIIADAGADDRPEGSLQLKNQVLPPLDSLIERGKVVAFNMPAGTNPALARAIGVLLKNAWLQTLLRRPAQMKANPDHYFRPAVFICDEYQSFATVGEDDPSGDEKAFALTRQCRVIPIVATQSISSLRAVLGSSEAWRSLL